MRVVEGLRIFKRHKKFVAMYSIILATSIIITLIGIEYDLFIAYLFISLMFSAGIISIIFFKFALKDEKLSIRILPKQYDFFAILFSLFYPLTIFAASIAFSMFITKAYIEKLTSFLSMYEKIGWSLHVAILLLVMYFLLMPIFYAFIAIWEELCWRGIILEYFLKKTKLSPLYAIILSGLLWGITYLPLAYALDALKSPIIMYLLILVLFVSFHTILVWLRLTTDSIIFSSIARASLLLIMLMMTCTISCNPLIDYPFGIILTFPSAVLALPFMLDLRKKPSNRSLKSSN